MNRLRLLTTAVLVLTLACFGARIATADSGPELQRNASRALQDLYASNADAKDLGKRARAVLVFPKIIKAGFMFGGQMGEGVLFKKGKPAGYYSSFAASYGFQAGLQWFGYALFFMNDSALSYLDKSDGWEIGSGPSVVVVEKGYGKSFTSTTLTQDVYAFIFSQKGLMGGMGLQGSKITKIDK
ncbi:MAG TPA: YSC84-related protein [Candidatus Binatia bacterium]|nr:YSC84-related protein [Candidatus Binatia bacterium]